MACMHASRVVNLLLESALVTRILWLFCWAARCRLRKVTAGDRDSWRSTLERYLTVRSALKIVFHLVDCGVGPQLADEQLMFMVGRALKARQEAK